MQTPQSLFSPFKIEGKDRDSQIIILCDHSSNFVPEKVNGGCLGLPAEDMERHIAYDVGAAGLSRELGKLMNAAVIYSNFSRLVIDPNRGEDDPTLLMRLYDGTLIPANRHADEAEKQRRLDLCHRPYHNAVRDLVSARPDPILIAVHSFTPQLRGRAIRPWEIGILFADDRRLSTPLIKHLQDRGDLCIGENQPYSGKLDGDTMDQHAVQHGHLHALVEVRNDLIEIEEGQKKWAEILAPSLEHAITAAQAKE